MADNIERADIEIALHNAIETGGTLLVADPAAPDDPDRRRSFIIKHSQVLNDGTVSLQIELMDGRLYRGIVRDVSQLAGGLVDVEIIAG